MNSRSRSAGLRDVLHIPRTTIKSKTSKSSVSHLARAQNYKRNCCLFTYKDVFFTQVSKVKKIIGRYQNQNKLSIINRRFLRIATWNIRTLNFSGEEVLDYTVRLSPNDKRQLLIKEVKRFGQGNIEIDGYILIWCGQPNKHYSGVAILIKKDLLRDVTK